MVAQIDDDLYKRIKELEKDLKSKKPKIYVYEDLPFAMFIYKPSDEYRLREHISLLKIRLESKGKRVKIVSLSKLFWYFIENSMGVDYFVKIEKEWGYYKAEEVMRKFLGKGKKVPPIHQLLLKEIQGLEPENGIVFLIRASVFAPFIYRTSVLLNSLHRETKIPIILFFPGKKRINNEIIFMNIRERGINEFNYRIKVYS